MIKLFGFQEKKDEATSEELVFYLNSGISLSYIKVRHSVIDNFIRDDDLSLRPL